MVLPHFSFFYGIMFIKGGDLVIHHKNGALLLLNKIKRYKSLNLRISYNPIWCNTS